MKGKVHNLRMNMFDRMVRSTLSGGVPLTIFILAIAAGILALQMTPREEEQQIVVPMVDVLIEAPGHPMSEAGGKDGYPMVSISVAKQRGSKAGPPTDYSEIGMGNNA